jgi:hypothetical protein
MNGDSSMDEDRRKLQNEEDDVMGGAHFIGTLEFSLRQAGPALTGPSAPTRTWLSKRKGGGQGRLVGMWLNAHSIQDCTLPTLLAGW